MQRLLAEDDDDAGAATLSARAYRSIRLALMSGYFRPGERLTMRGLADDLEMSVTPVREAIQLLITEHALFMPGARTVVVPRISREQYDEIIQIRGALESLAARNAMAFIDTAQLAGLRQINILHREAITSGNTAGALKNNRDFHFAIYRQCGLPSLIDLIENQWVRVGPMLNFLYPRYSQSLTGNRCHDRMIDAIAARSETDLVAALMKDLSTAKTEIHKILDPAV